MLCPYPTPLSSADTAPTSASANHSNINKKKVSSSFSLLLLMVTPLVLLALLCAVCRGDRYEHMRVTGADRSAIKSDVYNVLVCMGKSTPNRNKKIKNK